MITKKIDKIREHRIEMEIVVDAYGSEERAMGWYYYLEDKLEFPFKAMIDEIFFPLMDRIEAEVSGSSGRSYDVEITVAKSGIDAMCSCPYDE